jgi:hypothetical protein
MIMLVARLQAGEEARMHVGGYAPVARQYRDAGSGDVRWRTQDPGAGQRRRGTAPEVARAAAVQPAAMPPGTLDLRGAASPRLGLLWRPMGVERDKKVAVVVAGAPGAAGSPPAVAAAAVEVGVGDRLLLGPDTSVTCPDCDHEFSLEQGFAKRALEQLEDTSQGALRALEQSVRAAEQKRAAREASERERQALEQVTALRKLLEDQAEGARQALQQMRDAERRGFADQLAAMNALLAERDGQLRALADREAALATRERTLEVQVAAAAETKAAELFAAERASFEQQLKVQSRSLAQMRERELALITEKQHLADEKAAIELEVARKLAAGRAEIESHARALEKERADFEKAELQKKLDDVSGKLAEAQQKAEQGSQQLQGEVLELVLEEQMRRAFPVDVFEEVRKGVRGADLLQRVTTRSLQTAGTLLWEAKRAREWGRDWPSKLKEDMRASGADVGVLVTTALPREIPQGHAFGLHEDIWVCTWGAAVPLAAALRERVLEVHKQRLVSSGKGEKMEALYDYLTSPQFAQKLKAVYAAFRTMQDDLARERSQTEQRWARREKQIASGMRELLGFAGDVQGLSAQSLQQIELEPGGPEAPAGAPPDEPGGPAPAA